MIRIKTEADRVPEAVAFAKRQIDELERRINGCDYYEDINGKLVFAPGSYSQEKRDYEAEKRQWEIMLDILTRSAPCSLFNW